MVRYKTSISIEEDVWKAAKHHCVDLNMDISTYLETLVKKDLRLK